MYSPLVSSTMVKRPSKKVHLDPNDPKITSIKESSLTSGPCPICGTVMATRHGMRRHFKIMHKQAEASACKICGRKFLTTFAIQRHMRRVHPDEMNDSPPFRNIDGENPTSCPFCFKNFSGKQSLDRHLRIVHQHVEIGICSICDKTFSNKFAMKRHHENVHAASRHICSKCDLSFPSKFALMGHNLSSHNTSKIFACSHCSQCFLDASERNRHVTQDHALSSNPLDFQDESNKSTNSRRGLINQSP
ncbi:zinc finger protein [Echinococcus multilocularis]|uniref:Zinc finger protein n=1 Tax=Echinococcus multilocularis TaxID=6211 RepID=A0A087W212_ECHMU|nr:zinc finger protein [Echinococcus multilocularis]